MSGTGRAILALLASVLLAPTAQATERGKDMPPVEIVLKDHHFMPDKITVPAGKSFRIDLTNMDPNVSEFESYDMHFEKIVVGNGGKIYVYAGPLDAGRSYQFFDDYNPDKAQGVITAVTSTQ